MRGPCVDKNGFKKGAWSEEEDDKLRAYILRYGHWNWRLLPQFAGLARCGKSCRLRWLNYLKPGVRRGNYTKEEEDLIAKLHDEFGNKWSAIAAKLPGRTDNDIKNYWHTNMKKRTMRNIIAENNSMHKSSCKSKDSSSEALKRLTKLKKDLEPLDVHILESSGSNSENNPGLVNCDSEDSASSLRLLSEEIVLAETYSRRVLELFQDNSSYSSFAGFEESFWSEPFMVDSSTCYSQDHSFSVPLDEGDDGIFSGYLFS